MSTFGFDDVLARISQLDALVSSGAPPAPAQTQSATPTTPSLSFADLLAGASSTTTVAAAMPYADTATGTGTDSGSGVLAAAESQLGVTEQPPGSNDGPQIATYRSAVAGAQAGEPWCAYFASWASAQAGTPLGFDGQGIGSVAGITSWAQQTGRYLPAGSVPQAGDLILYGDQHVGIVESVNPDGSLTTVEGNYANGVNRVHRLPSEATGYVRVGDASVSQPETQTPAYPTYSPYTGI
jgi:hypothetical protein